MGFSLSDRSRFPKVTNDSNTSKHTTHNFIGSPSARLYRSRRAIAYVESQGACQFCKSSPDRKTRFPLAAGETPALRMMNLQKWDAPESQVIYYPVSYLEIEVIGNVAPIKGFKICIELFCSLIEILPSLLSR